MPKTRPTANPPLHLTAAALLGLLLAACTPPGPRPGLPAPVTETSRIEQLLAAGDFRTAADSLLAEAATQTSPRREELQLAAVGALLDGKYLDEAEQWLLQLPQTGSRQYTTRLVLLQARLRLERGDAHGALQQLATLGDAVAPEYLTDFHRTRAQAYALAGNQLEAARERVWLDGLLAPEDRPDNHLAIWQALSQLPDFVLDNLRTAPPPDTLSGWMELVQTTRSARDDPQQLETALAAWQQRYPGHPAAVRFLSDMRGRLAQFGVQPGQIAVLLPLSGALEEAGFALRDGIVAAHLQSADRDRVTLRFHDTGGASMQVWGIYQRAISEGAELVIGPLTKEGVAELARAGTLEVPVLALNAVDGEGTFPPQLFQYSLSPDDEARQVADRAWQDGHRRALALVPEGSFGERMQQAFAERWQALGGELLETQSYGADQRGYSNVVRDLLNIDASERRYQALSRLLGQRPEFEPRRRQDVDFVYLVAYPQQARLLRPILRFHRASRLPVYASSQVYSGAVNADLDRDLDGLRFCDMPWTLQSEHPAAALRGEIARHWPEREQRYTRLYAMGVDAFQLTPYLLGLSDGAFARHPGVTGDLYLDQTRRVHRDLQWSQFKDGRPAPLPPVIPVEEPMYMDETGGSEPSDTQDITDEYPVTNIDPSAGSAR